MDNHPNVESAIGFCLLPSELIQNILLHLALPDIVRLKAVNKLIASIVADKYFAQECNSRSSTSSWLFIYMKRWRRDATLWGFTDQCDRWFEIPVAKFLIHVIYPGEDLYFLTASGNFFLFVSNTLWVVISVNLMSKAVKKIPPGPLGPRGTASWRRSGLKLVAGPSGSDYFRFLFAELHENRPVLFEYDSRIDKWQSMEVRENIRHMPRVSEREGQYIFLTVVSGRIDSVIVAVGSESNSPVVLRPRFEVGGNREEQQLAVGFSWGNAIDRLHVYGDGNMMVVQSDGVDGTNGRIRMVTGIEVWSLSLNGRHWELITKVPNGLLEKIRRPYGVIMGCLEERNLTIRVVLMSNFEGLWDLIWLSYDIEMGHWTWVPLPDCKMKGLNMAGISFSSRLTLS